MTLHGKNDNPKKLQFRFIRRRYRGRIGCLPPEVWVALSYLLFSTGWIMLLLNKYLDPSDPNAITLRRLAKTFILYGVSAWIYVYDSARFRAIIPKPPQRSKKTKPSFVGVCRPPPIHQEWLSAQLLPAVNREWVPGDTLPGYEPHQGEFGQPPTRPKATSLEEEKPSTPVRRDHLSPTHTKQEAQKSPSSSRPDQQSPESSRPDQQSLESSRRDQQSPVNIRRNQQTPRHKKKRKHRR